MKHADHLHKTQINTTTNLYCCLKQDHWPGYQNLTVECHPNEIFPPNINNNKNASLMCVWVVYRYFCYRTVNKGKLSVYIQMLYGCRALEMIFNDVRFNTSHFLFTRVVYQICQYSSMFMWLFVLTIIFFISQPRVSIEMWAKNQTIFFI